MNRREALFSAVGAATMFSATGRLAAQPSRNATLEDARAFQDSTLLVDQLDGSAMTDEYLTMLESAGVDIWQGHGMSSIGNATTLLSFLDKHSKRLVLVKNRSPVV